MKRKCLFQSIFWFLVTGVIVIFLLWNAYYGELSIYIVLYHICFYISFKNALANLILYKKLKK